MLLDSKKKKKKNCTVFYKTFESMIPQGQHSLDFRNWSSGNDHLSLRYSIQNPLSSHCNLNLTGDFQVSSLDEQPYSYGNTLLLILSGFKIAIKRICN